jgi:phosphoglycolate phosphatase-like HAD superfamily hydrolase
MSQQKRTRFSAIPQRAFGAGLKTRHHDVLGVIAGAANKQGLAQIRQTTIAGKLRRRRDGPRGVAKTVSELRHYGLIEVLDDGRAKGRASTYAIRYEVEGGCYQGDNGGCYQGDNVGCYQGVVTPHWPDRSGPDRQPPDARVRARGGGSGDKRSEEAPTPETSEAPDPGDTHASAPAVPPAEQTLDLDLQSTIVELRNSGDYPDHAAAERDVQRLGEYTQAAQARLLARLRGMIRTAESAEDLRAWIDREAGGEGSADRSQTPPHTADPKVVERLQRYAGQRDINAGSSGPVRVAISLALQSGKNEHEVANAIDNSDLRSSFSAEMSIADEIKKTQKC